MCIYGSFFKVFLPRREERKYVYPRGQREREREKKREADEKGLPGERRYRSVTARRDVARERESGKCVTLKADSLFFFFLFLSLHSLEYTYGNIMSYIEDECLILVSV